MVSNPRLAIRGLGKTFGRAQVLSGVDLVVDPGEVHGLAGQNGCGKSTLVKIITGLYTPDPGARLEVDGQSIRLPVRWPEVHNAGVSVVHQDLGLLDEFSVADNICIGGYPRRPMTNRIDRSQLEDLASSALARVGASIDPSRKTATLSAPERAEVAVARALRDHRHGAGLVIMDESTRALTGAALQRMHHILRDLAAAGTSVLLISHSLPELIAVTDRVTVLRDGRVSGAALPTSELSEQEIALRMLGSEGLPNELEPEGAAPHSVKRSTESVLVVSELGGRRVRDVAFSIDRGQVVGITGVPGSGYEDIPYLMTAAITPRQGRLVCGNRTVKLADSSVADCLRAGVVLVPEERGRHGLAGELSVRDNLTLPNLRRRGRSWFVGRRWQDQDVAAALATFDIRPPNPDLPVKSLSGGNQQKVLLAKWMSTDPAVMILHEPTQAVDVGARRDILTAVRRAADRGKGVLVVSGEPADLCAICDVIYVAKPDGGLMDVGVPSSHELLDFIYVGKPNTQRVEPSHA